MGDGLQPSVQAKVKPPVALRPHETGGGATPRDLSWLYKTVVGGLIGVLALALILLAWAILDGQDGTSPDLLLTVFTGVLGALVGLFCTSALSDRPSGCAQAAGSIAWRVSVNTVADSMRRQGLVGRKVKRTRGSTRQDRTAPKFGDLLKRDFTAAVKNQRWAGDMTEIPTDEGKLYLASVIGLCSRRLLAASTSEHPNAELACDAIRMATAVRGGAANIAGVIFHTDRGSTYTAGAFTTLCAGLSIRQSMGRTGSCFDNAAAESFFSTLEWEVLSRHRFATREQARQVISTWIEEFYNPIRRHSTVAMRSPIEHENDLAAGVLIDEQAA